MSDAKEKAIEEIQNLYDRIPTIRGAVRSIINDYERTRARIESEAMATKWPAAGHPHCQAGSDGDCLWPHCPQVRDDEPAKTGRHCPIDNLRDDD